jgi:hypothetical protein
LHVNPEIKIRDSKVILHFSLFNIRSYMYFVLKLIVQLILTQNTYIIFFDTKINKSFETRINNFIVHNYWASFGLYPSFGIYKTKNHKVSETRSVSVLRWMGQDKPTQLGPLERASLNHRT